MLGVRHEKEGKLRVTYAHWDDAKVVLDGHVFRRNGAIRSPSPLSSHPSRKTGGVRAELWDHPMPKNVRNRPRLSKPRA